MQYFQILSCNDTLGTCCSDYGLVTVLDLMRKFFDIFQMVVPIILLVMATVQFIKLMVNPEEKNGMKKITNKLIATFICFFLPTIVNAMMNMMPSNETFQVGDCWEQAKISSEVLRVQKSTYISLTDEPKSSFLINPEDYTVDPSPDETGNGHSTVTGAKIVNYARKFVGQRYVYGGQWNGEEPYSPTDCSGFVQAIYRHFGINLQRTTSAQWADKSTYTLITDHTDIRAGDLVMYDGHVGILTGNGTEVIHAKGSAYGVVSDPDYRKCSSHAILGIMRIKGV